MLPYAVGLGLAVAIALFARLTGFDRDRAFYPVVLLVVAALAGHGVFDALHGHILQNAGVPAWWPEFCATYDVGAAAVLALIVIRDDRSRQIAERAA